MRKLVKNNCEIEITPILLPKFVFITISLMSTLWLISGVIMLSVAVVFAYRPMIPAVVPALAGLFLMRLSKTVHIENNTFLFWCVAAMIIILINSMTSHKEKTAVVGSGYIVTGAMVGMFVGLLASTSGMIIGAVGGALLGAMAFSRTPAGHSIPVASKRFLHNLYAVGMQAVVTMCIIGLVISGLLMRSGVIAR